MKLFPVAAMLAVFTTVSEPLLAGNVLVVDPTNPAAYADIQSAINAAAPGDILLVHPKPFTGFPTSELYASFTVDKSLAIVAEAGALVRCRPSRIENLGPEDEVLLRDLVFERVYSPIYSNLVLENNEGKVWIEGCTFRISADHWNPLPFIGCSAPVPAGEPAVKIVGFTGAPPGSTAIVRCLIEGSPGWTQGNPGKPFHGCQIDPGKGLDVDFGLVAIWDSVITGGAGQVGGIGASLPGGTGGDAVRCTNSYLFASGSIFTGGDGGDADSFAFGCVPGGDGGNGLVLNGGTTELLDTARLGGTGGAAAGTCAGGSAGVGDVGSPITLSGPSYSAVVESPKREGQNLHLEVSGPVGGYYLVDLDTYQTFTMTTITGIHGVRHIAGIGTTSGSLPLHPSFTGQFSASPTVIQFPLTGLLGGQQGLVYYFQYSGLDTYPGGQQANSAPTALVLLDSSL